MAFSVCSHMHSCTELKDGIGTLRWHWDTCRTMTCMCNKPPVYVDKLTGHTPSYKTGRARASVLYVYATCATSRFYWLSGRFFRFL